MGNGPQFLSVGPAILGAPGTVSVAHSNDQTLSIFGQASTPHDVNAIPSGSGSVPCATCIATSAARAGLSPDQDHRATPCQANQISWPDRPYPRHHPLGPP